MYVPQKHFDDFGPRNIALIAVVAIILGSLAWSQRPIRTTAIKYGTSLNSSLAADNSSPKVLGASEINQALVDQFAPIQITTSTDNSKQAFLNYATQVNVVEKADKLELLLNGNVLERSKDGQDKLIADLKRIAVPSVLADYHKLLLAYYQLKFEQQTSLNSDQIGAYVTGVQAELSKMRSEYFVSAGVSLP